MFRFDLASRVGSAPNVKDSRRRLVEVVVRYAGVVYNALELRE
jgi:hypothetical protein